MDTQLMKEQRAEREAAVGKRATLTLTGRVVAPQEWELGGWLLFEPDDDCFPAKIGVSMSNLKLEDRVLGTLGNTELGQAIVRETQQRDQLEESGLPVGEVQSYLERLTAEFERRRAAGKWDVS